MASDGLRPVPTARPQKRQLLELACVVMASFFVPLISPLIVSGSLTAELAGTRNSQIASVVAAIVALLVFRRVTRYPGAVAFAYMLPAFSTTFGLATAFLLASRVSYSGTMLLVGYVASAGTTFVLSYLKQRAAPMRMYFIPGGNTGIVIDAPQVEWIKLDRPEVPSDPDAAIVADLHCSHGPKWERMLAEAAIWGRAVYHTKQLSESLTGRVEIEHLSENSFGSLLPNLAYRGAKRMVDVVACVILLPILAIPLLIVALLIRLDSSGPALFRQQRMGYQGQPFNVLKFRTMVPRSVGADPLTNDLITRADDDRITRIGRFLRRSRIDELPQIINVLRGEMSWIGPRPEAMSLSAWYERELPFYIYRHIVRPGITGWAQVNQGHVAELDEVHQKLHYDFYYIKYFSAWLDILIAMRTVGIIISGFGAR